MKKLKLETLEVESFPTTSELDTGVGTVHGQSGEVPTCDVTACHDTCRLCSVETYSQDTRPECNGWSDTDYSACLACTTYGYPGGGDACNPTDWGTCVNVCTG